MHWKNQCRSTIRKHALLWNKYEFQHCAGIFVNNIFNPFHGTGLFLYSLKCIKNQMFSEVLRGHRNRSVPWNALRVIKSSVIYLVTYVSNWILFILLKSFLQNKIVFISYNVDKIVFILFNTSIGFFFQLEACMIYCFHALFVFDFVMDVLIVVYAPRVYLIEVKVDIYLLVFGNKLLFWY